jgi:NADPH:quinone reductase-like Zn-dependent oxidoreductase
MRAVRFEQYGGPEVLEVVEVPDPVPGAGEALVRVKATSMNPGEAKIRQGQLHDRFPATFPSGEGSDLAGVVEAVGPEVEGFAVGDEVIGFTDDRASHAELVRVPVAQLTSKPLAVPWEVAGSLFVAGTTAVATVRAVGISRGDVVAVAGAAGAVGGLAAQLAVEAGARVVGIAGPDDLDWLAGHGVVPVAYGEGMAERLAEAAPALDAFIDAVGGGYVQLAVERGVAPDRIDTIADFAAVETYGVKAEGSAAAASAETLAFLADLVADGKLEVPIARTLPLDQVQEAHRLVETRHGRGKVVLIP